MTTTLRLVGAGDGSVMAYCTPCRECLAPRVIDLAAAQRAWTAHQVEKHPDQPDPLLATARRLADMLGSEGMGENVGTHMTCQEAEAVAAVLRAVGDDAGAEAFLRGHAQDDDGGDEHGDLVQPHNCDRCGTRYDEASGDGYCGLCPSCADQDTNNTPEGTNR